MNLSSFWAEESRAWVLHLLEALIGGLLPESYLETWAELIRLGAGFATELPCMPYGSF